MEEILSIGQRFRNGKDLEFIVTGIIPPDRSSPRKTRTRYRVRFTNTGYEVVTSYDQILVGEVKDRLNPQVSGVGYIGDIRMKDHRKEYKIWHAMLDRCYNRSNVRYRAYGGAGVTVCNRWHNFSNFIDDIQGIDGYSEDLFDKSKIDLDKDLKQLDVPKNKRVYSKETCTFISSNKNRSMAERNRDSQKKYYVAIAPDGNTYEVFGMKTFCKEHGLDSGAVFGMLRGETSHVKGWKFQRI